MTTHKHAPPTLALEKSPAGLAGIDEITGEGLSKEGPTLASSTQATIARLPQEMWQLRLYVAGQTPRSLVAFVNLKKICENHLAGRYRIELVDLMDNPTLASADQVLAIPTLVRKLPAPIKKIIGDLSNTERVLSGLDMRPRT